MENTLKINISQLRCVKESLNVFVVGSKIRDTDVLILQFGKLPFSSVINVKRSLLFFVENQSKGIGNLPPDQTSLYLF